MCCCCQWFTKLCCCCQRLNEDALTQASHTYNRDLSKLKAHNDKLEYSLNTENMNREKLEADVSGTEQIYI